ncbi:MAG: ArnT family glycosyltransferase [Verrucomicrobium sp.]
MSDSSDQASRSGGTRGPSWGGVIVFFAVLVAFFFVHLFATFRGIASPAAMDAAQIAREFARGNGFHTKVIRPYAWQQRLQAGKNAPLMQMQDAQDPPLPALLLVPLFKVFKDQWAFPESSRIYPLDRVVAGLSLLLFVGAIGLTYLTVQRVFDGWIAGWTVLLMLFCQFLWDLGRGGLAPMMLFFLFALAVYWMVIAMELPEEGKRGAGKFALGIGVLCALMVLTHWMALWLVLGFTICVALWFRPRMVAVWILVLPLLALIGWGWRNQGISGDVLGSSKAILQATLATSSDSQLLRDFSGVSPPVDLSFLLRRGVSNVAEQLRQMYSHLGSVLPALLFFLALLHPFRRVETSQLRWAMAILWGSVLVGMCFMGLPKNEKDVNQCHYLFIPLFAAYGLAFLSVLWARLGFSSQNWWGKNGLAAGAFALSALPLISVLPMEILTGLYNKGQFAHWPPYLPDRISKVKEFVAEDELIYTDVPWAVAWYADRTAVWLPVELAQFAEMRERSKAEGNAVAGLLLSPASAEVATVPDVFSGPYRAWAPEVYRGAGIGLGLDTLSTGPFPFKEIFPLAGYPVGSRFVVQMAFMSDTKRWEQQNAAQ